jgi:hypothetical protein
MKSLHGEDGIRLLPYPDGKAFAFTIIDDTDESRLETVRPVYDFLFALGLRTTKTVWVRTSDPPPRRTSDKGDTLENEEYAAYMRLLRQRGFEIALHNVSSASNKRADIADGLAVFTRIVGDAPKINVHHEKNLENLYFDFAQSGRHLPPPFRTAFFQGLYELLGRARRKSPVSEHACSGENPRSDYFWGDICKANIPYVRTNVFFSDLNTLKCSPVMPFALAETPYVNYWFDSSNGQDVHYFNSILSDRNIDRLRSEQGCSILYTHFGKGFVERSDGAFELNTETKRRLQSIAGRSDGWYAPVTEILDRLRAFQHVTMLPLGSGILVTNHNDFPINSLTLHTTPGAACCDPMGRRFTADSTGKLVIPVLPPATSTAVLGSEFAAHATRWNEDTRNGLLIDLAKVTRKLGHRLPWQEPGRGLGTKA